MHGLLKYALLLLFFLPAGAFGQELSFGSLPNEDIYRARIKQFDDFASRFNAITTGAGEDDRALALGALFNHEDPRFFSDDPAYSPEYVGLVTAFMAQVLRDSLTIDTHSENIHARALSLGRLDQEEVRFSSILKQERVGKDMLKWVLLDVEADFLDIMEYDSSMLRFLPPSSGELDFKELIRAMEDQGYQHYYAHRDFNYDRLSVFFYLLSCDRLQLESILEVRYLVYEIQGWCITLKDFTRESKNSGWLVHDLSRR